MTLRTVTFCLLTIAAGSGQAASNICGGLSNGYGPFDYRKASTDYVENLRLVEHAHFTEEIEQGIRGNSSTIGGDLDYALRAFPNHTRALAAMGRQAIKTKVLTLPGAKWPAECYFDRAIRFAPDDGAVRASYGSFLFAKGNVAGALKMFAHAVELEPENASINYNLALAHFKTRNFEQANLYAQRAYALGFPLPGMKNLLIGAGKWDDSVRPPAPVEPAQTTETTAQTTADPVKPPPPHE
jgi:tetratricopeptide (TPR) repeat protein